MTRNRLISHAIPIPSAAHCTHHSPGDVIRLMTNSRTRIKGPVNRNLKAFAVRLTLAPRPEFDASRDRKVRFLLITKAGKLHMKDDRMRWERLADRKSVV